MKELIRTFKCRYKLFRQPNQIGSTIESDEKLWLIIGIEKFELVRSTLLIWYTCQDLSRSDYLFIEPPVGSDMSEVEIELQAKFDHKEWERFRLGRTTNVEGKLYKLIEYTEISLKSTDLYASVIAKRIYPINRKEAKFRFLNERKKQLKLEVH